MTSPPDSYQDLSLPAVRLSHHPPSSKTVTPVVMVILNRPKHKNAFNVDMINSLEKAFGMLSSDPRVKCVVLTGSDPQNRIFCAGMDLAGGKAAGDNSDGPPDSAGPVSRDTRMYIPQRFKLIRNIEKKRAVHCHGAPYQHGLGC